MRWVWVIVYVFLPVMVLPAIFRGLGKDAEDGVYLYLLIMIVVVVFLYVYPSEVWHH